VGDQKRAKFGVRVHRPELALCALLCSALGWFAPAYWALEPAKSLTGRFGLWTLAVACAALALSARREPATRGRAARFALVGLGLVVGLYLCLILGWMHAAGYLTAFIVAADAALAALAVEVVGLALCAWWLWRHPSRRRFATGLAATLLFGGSSLFFALNTWMWRPPTPAVCESVLRPGEVEQLSPAHWAQDPSYPFKLLYIEADAQLVASFKMGGNGHLSFWDEPAGNRVFAVDISNPSRVGELSLTGQKLPCYLTHHPVTGDVLMSRMGPGDHTLDLLGLDDFPHLTLESTVSLDYSPHEVVSHPTERTFGVVGQDGRFVILDEEASKEVAAVALDRGGDHAAVPLYTWQPDPSARSSKVYISFLLYPLAEIDLDTHALRWSQVDRFGGGQLAGHFAANELFHTDLLFNRVDVLDLDDLTMTRRLDLDYTPRPVHVDASRDLLIVGDWFGGVAHLHRLSTLEPLGVTVPVGPYLRDFAYDVGRGLLFTASQCGVLQVHVDKLLAERAP